jgi:hypothetical protein
VTPATQNENARISPESRGLQRITLTRGRGARFSIKESLLPRASTVHNGK